MAINVNDNLHVLAAKSIDDRYGKLVSGVFTPFSSVSEANTLVLSAYRHKGLTVLIDSGATWQYSFTAAYNLTANGQARTTTTQSGADLALSAGMLIRISYNTGALVFEYSNNGGTSWTTIGTSGTAHGGHSYR